MLDRAAFAPVFPFGVRVRLRRGSRSSHRQISARGPCCLFVRSRTMRGQMEIENSLSRHLHLRRERCRCGRREGSRAIYLLLDRPWIDDRAQPCLHTTQGHHPCIQILLQGHRVSDGRQPACRQSSRESRRSDPWAVGVCRPAGCRPARTGRRCAYPVAGL